MTAAHDMITAGLKMIAALGVVLALMLLLLRGMRKLSGKNLGAGGGKRIQVLESHYLGVKKSICLVRVPGKVLVLGIANDRINLLDTLGEDAVEMPAARSDTGSFGPVLRDRLKTLGLSRKGRDPS
jgi:flagellar protein FliO/FliZ